MISIIIVSFNTSDLLANCIRSIYGSNIRADFEIIVVDNNSKDDSVAMCRTQFPNVQVIENKVNNMFAKANNQGIAIARGDAVLLLNSDTVVDLDVVDTLYRFMRGNHMVAAVGPRLINVDGSLQSQGYPLKPMLWTVIRNFSLDNALPPSIRHRLMPWTNPVNTNAMRVGWVGGACMLISKQAIGKVGGLCEALYFYGEEVEWCWRARNGGMQIWCLPQVSVLHLGGASTKSPQAPIELKINEHRMASTLELVKKTTGVPYNLVLGLVIVSALLIKLPIAYLLRPPPNPLSKDILVRLLNELRFMRYQANWLLKIKR